MPRRRKSAPREPMLDPRHGVQAQRLAEVAASTGAGDFEAVRALLGAPRRADQALNPVTVSGPTIGVSALGRAWYRFVETTHGRLVRGRAYLRASAVLDLQVHRGIVNAEVQGTQRYHVKIAVALPGGPQLAELRTRLGAAVTLRGAALHEVILGPLAALMPAPRHMVPFCQCLDPAPFCKHVCAALYGLGVRLDSEPELLLVLRGLIAEPPTRAARPALTPLAPEKALGGDLGALFGIDLLAAPAMDAPAMDAPAMDAPAMDAPAMDAPAMDAPAMDAPAPAPGPSPEPEPSFEPGLPPEPSFEPDLDLAPPTPSLDFEPSGPAEIRREYLRELGIPTPTIDAWLREGVLRRTGRHGVYERTPEASRRIAAHLAA